MPGNDVFLMGIPVSTGRCQSPGTVPRSCFKVDTKQKCFQTVDAVDMFPARRIAQDLAWGSVPPWSFRGNAVYAFFAVLNALTVLENPTVCALWPQPKNDFLGHSGLGRVPKIRTSSHRKALAAVFPVAKKDAPKQNKRRSFDLLEGAIVYKWAAGPVPRKRCAGFVFQKIHILSKYVFLRCNVSPGVGGPVAKTLQQLGTHQT